MRVAVTADVHLSTEHPERREHFEKLLRAVSDDGIQELIVAGDLFDQGASSVPEFDRMAARHEGLRFHVIRGNHDADLRAAHIEAPNVEVYDEPRAVRLGAAPVVFLPYMTRYASMGEALEASGVTAGLSQGRYVLVSHGDYGAVHAEANGGEQGYFPLSQADIGRYRPAHVLLGHIHKVAAHNGTVRYPGSPYPLDPTETGPRRILILDTETLRVSGRRLGYTPVYEELRLLMVPADDPEAEQQELAERLRAYLRSLLGPDDPAQLSRRLQLRVRVEGYARAREGVAETVTEVCRGFGVPPAQLSVRNNVAVAAGDERSAIAAELRGRVDEIARREPELDATRLLRRSLEYIFAED